MSYLGLEAQVGRAEVQCAVGHGLAVRLPQLCRCCAIELVRGREAEQGAVESGLAACIQVSVQERRFDGTMCAVGKALVWLSGAMCAVGKALVWLSGTMCAVGKALV